MVVGMQHQQREAYASPATPVDEACACTPYALSPQSPAEVPMRSPSPSPSAGTVHRRTAAAVHECSSTTSVTNAADSLASDAVAVASASAGAVDTRDHSESVHLVCLKGRVKLKHVNEHLVCFLCRGYLVDATSITECLHTFCRSCIILYLANKDYCPKCEVQINNSKPHLSLKPDKTLQDIVYKLVPGLFHAEMKRRNRFYLDKPDRDTHLHPEFRGMSVDRLVYSPRDTICLSMEYYDNAKEREDWENTSARSRLSAAKAPTLLQEPLPVRRVEQQQQQQQHQHQHQHQHQQRDWPSKRAKHFECPAALKISHLSRLIRLKYNLLAHHHVELFHRRESLPEDYSLMDVAYIYAWKRNSPLKLYYRISLPADHASLSRRPLSVASSIRPAASDHRRNGQLKRQDSLAPTHHRLVFTSKGGAAAAAQQEEEEGGSGGGHGPPAAPTASSRIAAAETARLGGACVATGAAAATDTARNAVHSSSCEQAGAIAASATPAGVETRPSNVVRSSYLAISSIWGEPESGKSPSAKVARSGSIASSDGADHSHEAPPAGRDAREKAPVATTALAALRVEPAPLSLAAGRPASSTSTNEPSGRQSPSSSCSLERPANYGDRRCAATADAARPGVAAAPVGPPLERVATGARAAGGATADRRPANRVTPADAGSARAAVAGCRPVNLESVRRQVASAASVSPQSAIRSTANSWRCSGRPKGAASSRAPFAVSAKPVTSQSPSTPLPALKPRPIAAPPPTTAKIPSSSEISFSRSSIAGSAVRSSLSPVAKSPPPPPPPPAMQKTAATPPGRANAGAVSPAKRVALKRPLASAATESPAVSIRRACLADASSSAPQPPPPAPPPPKTVFAANILPEVSITLNPHPERPAKRMSPETSFDVTCFKPPSSLAAAAAADKREPLPANGVPPLAPIVARPNIRSSPVPTLNGAESRPMECGGPRTIALGPPAGATAAAAGALQRLSPALQQRDVQITKMRKLSEDATRRAAVYHQGRVVAAADGARSNGVTAPTRTTTTTTTTPPPSSLLLVARVDDAKSCKAAVSPSARKEGGARHQGIPQLIDITTPRYTQLRAAAAQNAKMRAAHLLLANNNYGAGLRLKLAPVKSLDAATAATFDSSSSPLCDNSRSAPAASAKLAVPPPPPPPPHQKKPTTIQSTPSLATLVTVTGRLDSRLSPSSSSQTAVEIERDADSTAEPANGPPKSAAAAAAVRRYVVVGEGVSPSKKLSPVLVSVPPPSEAPTSAANGCGTSSSLSDVGYEATVLRLVQMQQNWLSTVRHPVPPHPLMFDQQQQQQQQQQSPKASACRDSNE